MCSREFLNPPREDPRECPGCQGPTQQRDSYAWCPRCRAAVTGAGPAPAVQAGATLQSLAPMLRHKLTPGMVITD